MSEINEELISAYLDHELSTEERELVEAALAHDPKLRQLKDELEMLQEDFELLPVYHALDIQQVIRKAANQPTVQLTPKISTNRGSSPSNKKRWLSAGVGIAACLLLAVTLINQPSDTKPLAMSDSVSSPPAEMNAPLKNPLVSRQMTMELEEDGAMGGLAIQEAAEMEDAISSAVSSPPKNDNANAGVKVFSAPLQNKADQTIRITVEQKQLVRLLATIEPTSKKSSVANGGVPELAQARKSNAVNEVNQPKELMLDFDEGLVDLAYAMECTPEELVSLMAELQNAKYLPSSENADAVTNKKTRDHYKDQVKNKQSGKLQVLFLITVKPDLESDPK